ncbi:hypothetical protein P8C59_001508 [Phyllachora maydis]|uniref:Haloacid dehalogenase n=1 Tax=Phyllachora maydis TaxID=1825666 RepID=A0AAD9MCC9_9PEZI|nr:hypothetical protein P8C59_001508 [Phyllachora maydis]
MPSSRPLTSFSCLTFDCYGTLVDWEGGIFTSLAPLLDQLSNSHPLRGDRPAILQAFVRHEQAAQAADPKALYSRILATAYDRLAAELGLPPPSEGEKAAFGTAVRDWPAFPDTVPALHRLQKHYKLVILSNVDRESCSRTLATPLAGVEFDAIYTAEDIGSYKPDLRNFDYLVAHCEQELGVKKDEILHTAQSLLHDHVPAKKKGLVSAWIERGAGEAIPNVMGGKLEDFRTKVDVTWHFKTLGEMADAVDEAHGNTKS